MESSRPRRGQWAVVMLLAGVAIAACSHRQAGPAAAVDPLPSWNEGPARAAILGFIAKVTDPAGKDFVPFEDRIATFDNDGTLWPEQPVIQGLFIEAQLKGRRDKGHLVRASEAAIMSLVAQTSANMTDEQYRAKVQEFFLTARHPTLGVPFTSLAYRPMVELMTLLRASGFRVFISSGGGADFMRVVSQQMYGVPPENVIGTALAKEVRQQGGHTVLWRKPAIETINDKGGKPVNIDLHIGKRPLLAAGNVRSGGDIAMLSYSQVPGRPTLQLLIDHDDARREFAYAEKDGASLAAAQAQGWVVVSMKRDWRDVFAAPLR